MSLARITAAGGLYFGLVFAAGFALGTIRVIGLQPYLGASLARLAELPFMVVISYLAARRVTRLFGEASRDSWFAVGGLAFLMLMVAEAVLGIFLFRTPPLAILRDLLTPVGLVSFGAQALVIILPALAAGWDRTRA